MIQQMRRQYHTQEVISSDNITVQYRQDAGVRTRASYPPLDADGRTEALHFCAWLWEIYTLDGQRVCAAHRMTTMSRLSCRVLVLGMEKPCTRFTCRSSCFRICTLSDCVLVFSLLSGVNSVPCSAQQIRSSQYHLDQAHYDAV